MEPTSRLFQCALCHEQVVICSCCDRGQIYCANDCATLARNTSLKLIRARYQLTFNGKRHHAACQARYRMRLIKIVMDQGSPLVSQHDSIDSFENKAKEAETKHSKSTLTCSFCKKPVSDWLRNDFLRRRGHKKLTGSLPCSQAP